MAHIHADNFLESEEGIEVIEGEEGGEEGGEERGEEGGEEGGEDGEGEGCPNTVKRLLLSLPYEKCSLDVLSERLHVHDSYSSTCSREAHIGEKEGGAEADFLFKSLIAPKSLLILCGFLSLISGSVSLLALVASVWSTRCLLNEMSRCEEKWHALQRKFNAWREEVRVHERLEVKQFVQGANPKPEPKPNPNPNWRLTGSGFSSPGMGHGG